MFLQAKKPKPSRRRVSKSTSIQAPTGGLNAKDAYAHMKETEAIVLENWFPTPSSVDIRKGRQTYATGLPGAVDTLAFYNDGVNADLFAVSGGRIYDVSSAGPVGTALVTGLSNSRWQTVNFGTAGGFFLLMVNGADKMRYYNGTSWSADGGTYTVTGVNTQQIEHITNFKNRIFLIEKNSFNAWYLPVSSIGGAAKKLDLSGLFKLGGYLMAMANWTIDNSQGVNDYAVFITSEGEVAMYDGSDPNNAADWNLVGTFRMGKPIGRRCFCKAGADVLVITTDGAFPLSKSLLTDRAQLNLAATDKIADLFNSDIYSYQSNFGWQPIIHPIGQKLIINVPTAENQESHQYVMNTANGSWTKFTNWNANCFETLRDQLFYGGNGTTYIADNGADDDGSEIVAVCQQAFSYFGSAGQQKKFSMARPVFISDGDINPAVALNTDFSQDRTATSGSFTMSGGSAWDTSPWNTSPWASGLSVTKRWLGVTGVGFAGSLRIVCALKGIVAEWQSTDFLYEVGELL